MLRKIVSGVVLVSSVILFSIPGSLASQQIDFGHQHRLGQLQMADKNANGANISNLSYKNFTYDSKRDLQQVEITWKANRGNSFEILATSDGLIPDQYLSRKTGTSQLLTVPANGTLHIALRAEKYPNHILRIDYRSPLQFNILVLPDSVCLKDKLTSKADRAQLWQIVKNRKIAAILGIFALVAPAAINAVPGTSLADALASTLVGAAQDIHDPLEVNTFARGLLADVESGVSGYFYGRCIP